MPVAYGLIEPAELHLPLLPAALEGRRVAHLTDLHISPRTAPSPRLLEQLARVRFDLLVLTGDYINETGDEPVAAEFLRTLCRTVRPAWGVFGVFGNHDTATLQRLAADPSLPVTWLDNRYVSLTAAPIDLFGVAGGFDRIPDSLAMMIPDAAANGATIPWTGVPTVASGERGRAHPGDATDAHAGPRRLRLLLTHEPAHVATAADLGVDIVLAGHTHGGHCRLPTGRAVINATDLPLRLSAGVMRHRDTLLAISRGLGGRRWPPRMFCPPHVPLYTLRRRPMPGRSCHGIELIQPW